MLSAVPVSVTVDAQLAGSALMLKEKLEPPTVETVSFFRFTLFACGELLRVNMVESHLDKVLAFEVR